MYNSSLTLPTISDMNSFTTAEMLTTTPINFTERCEFFKKMLTFDSIQLIRVIVTWTLFLFSSCGNIFILYCIYKVKRRTHVHTLTLHLTLADLAFTIFVIPIDGTWNITMEWLGGDFLCRAGQMMKQFGMYISSFMVVVISLDRCCSILNPMSGSQVQANRIKFLLSAAWLLSFFSSIPAGVLFSVSYKLYCPGKAPFKQCVDFKVVTKEDGLEIYHIFTMLMSFILPFLIAVISYILVIFEIQNMQQRDQKMMGRRESATSDSIEKARRKTMILTSLVTLTFVLLWGPYYGIGIVTWFDSARAIKVPREISMWLFILMYFHPTVHPIIYGIFMKNVRKTFLFNVRKFYSCISFGKISKETNTPSSNKCYPCFSKADEYPFLAMKKKSDTQQFSGMMLSTPRTSRSGISDHQAVSSTFESPDISKKSDNQKPLKNQQFLSLPN